MGSYRVRSIQFGIVQLLDALWMPGRDAAARNSSRMQTKRLWTIERDSGRWLNASHTVGSAGADIPRERLNVADRGEAVTADRGPKTSQSGSRLMPVMSALTMIGENLDHA